MEDYKELRIEADTFDKLRRDADIVLQRALGTMLGNGNWMATDQFEGEGGTHTEFIEGLMSTDMRKTADDLACYMKNCV